MDGHGGSQSLRPSGSSPFSQWRRDFPRAIARLPLNPKPPLFSLVRASEGCQFPGMLPEGLYERIQDEELKDILAAHPELRTTFEKLDDEAD